MIVETAPGERLAETMSCPLLAGNHIDGLQESVFVVRVCGGLGANGDSDSRQRGRGVRLIVHLHAGTGGCLVGARSASKTPWRPM